MSGLWLLVGSLMLGDWEEEYDLPKKKRNQRKQKMLFSGTWLELQKHCRRRWTDFDKTCKRQAFAG